ncbi:MAG: diaminopimelate decarboxylase [Anaerolineaceae bacterium]|nr:diaminopimelate decarboxylase [Anaerolineaceae bacterium]
MLNDSIHYINGSLHCDAVPVQEILAQVGSPVYVYSLKRALHNLKRIQTAFAGYDAHIHYSAKANANLTLLRHLVQGGAGIDAVSAGEIHRALLAGTAPSNIVFAGVGKTPDELAYALEKNVGWFNVENVAECGLIDSIASQVDCLPPHIALRFNPDISASTHPYIATGHGGAKFGLTADVIADLLARQSDFPNVVFAGIHLHIGSQLHDTDATRQAVSAALDLIKPYPNIRTVNIGGGLPVAYKADDPVPDFDAFAQTLAPLLKDYTVLLEPGRSIIADAGILVANTLYVKKQAGQTFVITDASMSELIRPALYQAHHEIVPLIEPADDTRYATQVVGPVCETADVLGRNILLPDMSPGEPLAILNAGAYGMVMASNYNQRLRPPEVAVMPDGQTWQITRRRETWDDLLRMEAIL